MKKPIVISMFVDGPKKGWRCYVASWLRASAGFVDGGHAIVIATDDMKLLEACANRVVAVISADLVEQHLRESCRTGAHAAHLANWWPHDGVRH